MDRVLDKQTWPVDVVEELSHRRATHIKPFEKKSHKKRLTAHKVRPMNNGQVTCELEPEELPHQPRPSSACRFSQYAITKLSDSDRKVANKKSLRGAVHNTVCVFPSCRPSAALLVAEMRTGKRQMRELTPERGAARAVIEVEDMP